MRGGANKIKTRLAEVRSRAGWLPKAYTYLAFTTIILVNYNK